MRAIFMIPMKPAPRLPDDRQFSDNFRDFVEQCLQKDPENRPTATKLLKHPFIEGSPGRGFIQELVNETIDRIEEFRITKHAEPVEEHRSGFGDGVDAMAGDGDDGTMILSATSGDMGTMLFNDETKEEVGTMVLNNGLNATQNVPAYMRQFQPSPSAAARPDSTFYKLGKDLEVSRAATAEDLKKTITQLEVAQEEERRALDTFYDNLKTQVKQLMSNLED